MLRAHSSWKVRVSDIRYSAAVKDESDNGFKLRGDFAWLNPVGNEVWNVGDSKTISWTTTGPINNVKVEYTRDNWVNTFNILDNLRDSPATMGNSGYYGWSIPDFITSDIRVKLKITDANDSAVYMVSPVIGSNPGTLKIRGMLNVTGPAAGSVWMYNTQRTIAWDSLGSISAVKIEYSKDNGASWVTPPIEATCANDSGANGYSWLVPDEIVPDFRCLIRITDANDSSVYALSGGFKIRGDFAFTSPVGGEKWIVYNDPYYKIANDITWNTSGSIGNVDLYYSTDDFAGFAPPTPTANTKVIITSVGNTGVYSWRVPDRIAPNVKVRVYDSADYLVFKPSNSFKIRGDFIINSPKSMDEWIVYDPIKHNVTYPITWTTVGSIPIVKIHYWSTNANDWVELQSSWDNPGQFGVYNWDVRDDVSYGVNQFGVKIKITDPNDPTLVFKESAGFKIRSKFQVTNPITNTIWTVTKKYFINWITTGTAPLVRIEYLKGGIPNNWFVIPGAENYPNNTGSYEWTIPDDITQDFSTQVRILDTRDTSIISPTYYSQLSPGFKVRGEITVGQPNGNEQWDVGSIYPITWTQLGTIPDVKLEYSQNGLWTDTLPVTTSLVANNGSYNWQIPNKITPATSTVKVRISDPRDLTIYDDSNNGFKIRGKFNVTYPNESGIQLDVGSPCTMTWTTDGTVPNVKLEYSKDDFASDIHVIITTTPNGNSYVWTVPDDITPDFKVKVRVSDTRDYDAKDDSNNPSKIRAKFTVASPGAVTGTIWTKGETRPISWTNTGTVPNVMIEYSTDNFATVTNTIIVSLSNGASGTGRAYDWLVPDDITSPDFKVNVRVSDTRDYEARDDSDNPIKIKGDFIVGYPNGAEQLRVGEQRAITWTTIGIIPNVKLEYRYAGEWFTIITSTSNSTSTYNWQVPDKITLPPSDYSVLIRVSDTRDSNVTLDTSDNPFKIKADIIVVYPNGDENLLVETDEVVSWTVVGTVPNVRIEYSMDDFIDPAKTKIISTTANISGTNIYTWRVPDDISAGKITRVRVVDIRDDNSYDKSDFSFRIKGWFDITSPAINDIYIVGRQQSITWTTFGTMPTVKLEYSLDNFSSVITPIDLAIPGVTGTNVYSWIVPDDITPDDRVKVRVTTIEPNDPDINDVSVGFKIKADIQVVAPDGGERWISNEEHNITWVITGTVPSVTIYYSCSETFNAGIQLVVSDVPNIGYYNWTVPDRPIELQISALDKTKVRICDSRDLDSFDQSPNFFKIDYYYITFNVKDSV